MIEWDSGDEVVEDMGLDNAMHDGTTNEAKITIHSGCGSASEVPGASFIVWKGRIGVLEVCDCDCNSYKCCSI